MDFTVFNPSTMHPTPTYSKAVRVGGLVFLAGQVAKNQKGEIVGKGDPRAQTEQIFENLRTVLEAAGSGLDLVAKITIYTVNLDYRPAIGEVRTRVFSAVGHLPASTFLVVASLAEPDYLVEIEAVAAVR